MTETHPHHVGFSPCVIDILLKAPPRVALRMPLGDQKYEGTTRVVGYSTSAQAWGMIPYLGGVVSGVMTSVLHYHGFKQVHGLSKGRALFAALLPWIFVAGLVVAILVAMPFSMVCGHCG